MAARRVVVDGSNIATEGRTLPSLKQLNEAVLAFLNEYPDTEVTVVVDATFGHRIDPSEVAEFEEAEANAELVSPPAGAIGRGDAFLLRIAGKIGATVLSNDSFQEFHGEHEWLFEDSRLIGGKPVQGIGWIFTPRTPVRGIKSRKAVKEAKQKGGRPALSAAATLSGEPLGPMPSPKKPPPPKKGKEAKEPKEAKEAARIADAIATATEESVSGGNGGRKRRRKKRGSRPAEPVNDAQPFVDFIAAHPLGTQLEGEVETFTSHGAFVMAGSARCYVPISALGDPPPRAARDVLSRGERRQFVVQALDPQRRGIELALPEFAHVSGAPLPETIEAEISEVPSPLSTAAPRRATKKAPVAAPPDVTTDGAADLVAAPVAKTARRNPAKSATSEASAAEKKAPAKKGPAKKAAATVKKAIAKAASPATVKPAATVKKAVATKKAATKKAATTKTETTKKAAVTKKTAATKTAATKPAVKKTAAKKTAATKTAKATKATKTAKATKAARSAKE